MVKGGTGGGGGVKGMNLGCQGDGLGELFDSVLGPPQREVHIPDVAPRRCTPLICVQHNLEESLGVLEAAIVGSHQPCKQQNQPCTPTTLLSDVKINLKDL
jgi:hypothetical protein